MKITTGAGVGSFMKGRKAVRIVVVVAVVLALAVLVVSWILAGMMLTGKRQTLDEALAWQTEHYDTSFYDGLAKTDYLVAGAEGYELHVQELSNPTPSSRYVIISHGYTDNRMGALKYVPLYLELGFNCIIYDLRGHGLNAESCTTYGVLEGQDLACLVQDTRARHPELTQLGLQGESLGAASTISSLRYEPQIDFAVSDCAFSNIMDVLRKGYQDAGVPDFLLNLANLGTGLRYHHRLSEMRPIEALAHNSVPILFIHGANDQFIVPQHSQDLYDVTVTTGTYAELHFIEGAGHAESVLVNPEGYRAYVAAFLQTLPAPPAS